MAAAAAVMSCGALSSSFRTLAIVHTSNARTKDASFRSLSFSASTSHNLFSAGLVQMKPVVRPTQRSIVCEVAKSKADSAAKRARQAEKRRIYNKSRKSEVKTRMKTALEALDSLKKKAEAASEELVPIERLIGEAYSIIDKAIKVGTLHRNTGARRKSRLARRKKMVEIHHGWYTPPPPSITTTDSEAIIA
ncbi:30S ribosomal protein S20, chloroplastic [Impatiens glandulifera]|uniref:30S ribosomal protein S20, chloroplastic n=1 Tax=Impatiens glandulifera TaxID=253017 RepID=UPI001FB08691|nr:30S ribosomal protein S20, chloroplastic [Impatiens glandulifera]